MNASVPMKRLSSQAKFSQKKRKVFLEVLSRTGKVIDAAQRAGYADSCYLRSIYRDDENFAREWDEALNAAADVLEDEAIRRAHEGTMDPVYYKGNVVGFRVNYSDQLLMFLLRGARPDKFRENVKVHGEIKGNIGIAILPMTAPSLELWEKAALEVHQGQKLLDDQPSDNIIDVTPETVKTTQLERR